jgi:hypothetical protein
MGIFISLWVYYFHLTSVCDLEYIQLSCSYVRFNVSWEAVDAVFYDRP